MRPRLKERSNGGVGIGGRHVGADRSPNPRRRSCRCGSPIFSKTPAGPRPTARPRELAAARELGLEALRQDILRAPQVVWLSEGGRGLWRLFEEQCSASATGILYEDNVYQLDSLSSNRFKWMTTGGSINTLMTNGTWTSRGQDDNSTFEVIP